MTEPIENLESRWRALAAGPRGAAFAAEARAIAREVMSARAALWDENAKILVELADDDPALAPRTEANIDRVKRCTVVLGEMSAALGMTSLPEPE